MFWGSPICNYESGAQEKFEKISRSLRCKVSGLIVTTDSFIQMRKAKALRMTCIKDENVKLGGSPYFSYIILRDGL